MSQSPTNLQLLPLHTHTVYSVLDGASNIDEYLKWCKDNGASALGVTDHGWCIGGLELLEKSKKAGIKGLPGCEFYVIPDIDYTFNKKPYSYYHVTAWAINAIGYQNLNRLGSLSFQEEDIEQMVYDKETKTYYRGMKPRVVVKMWQPKPRITFSELLQYNEGLVLGSGCLIGAVNKALLEGEPQGAERNLLRLLEVYRGRFFMELMPHACTHDFSRSKKAFQRNECSDFAPDGDIQKACNLKNIDLARAHKLPLLMTVDSHFVDPKQKALQDVLLQNGDDSGWRFFESYHALTTAQAWKRWSETYGDDADQRRIFTEAVENTHRLASFSSSFDLQHHHHQPEITIPPDIQTLPVQDQLKTLLIRQIEVHKRMRWDDPRYRQRLAQELRVICDNKVIDFSRYFLFLEQWGRWSRDHSILSAPGRGSAAGSLLCYLLKITHLNPFEYNLPFERFLSQGRITRQKWPDIDWDLGQRDILIAELSKVYGDKFAQCSVHGTLKVKSAIKDACRVLWNWKDLPEAERTAKIAEVEVVTKTVPLTPTGVKDFDFLMGYTDTEGNIHDGHLDQNPILTKFFEKYPEILQTVLQLLGIPRSVGRHASAYFISDTAISESVPTCSISGHTCTQYVAGLAEKAGLIKFDFLRVNTLSDISGAIRLIQQRQGYKVERKVVTIDDEDFYIWTGELPVEVVPMPDGRMLDIYKLPEDEEVYKDFDLGKTETVFQMHTPLLTAMCKQIKPRKIPDLSAIVALVRPGPTTAKIDVGTDKKISMTMAYVERRNGTLPVIYPHPEMEPILNETQGVVVYQEQLQQIFSDLAGYSPEEADEIRELIAKKKLQEMEKAIPEIRNRLRKRDWSESQITMLVDLCIASASYSFNKSHSASYAIVAYQCIFLKHYFPVEWWTSVLQNAKVDDIREKHYADAIKDILVLPHVNGPMSTFELIEGKVHAPLYLIDGIGKAACQAIASEHEKNGPYKDFFDFYNRIDKSSVDKGIFEAMVLCGAFDLIQQDMKPQELWDAYCYLRRVQELKIGKDKKGQALLDAVHAYQGEVDMPSIYQDAVELEMKRMSYLPIYRMDCLERFKKLFQAKKFMYDAQGLVTAWIGTGMLRVLRNERDIPEALGSRPFGFVGFLREDASEFQYADKRTKKRVTACKFFLVNDGDALECVLWPNLYEDLGKPNRNRIIFAHGIIRESREPGKYQMFVQSFDHI